MASGAGKADRELGSLQTWDLGSGTDRVTLAQRLRALTTALDHRTGYKAILEAAGGEQVLGGARFAYVFGSALVFTFILQVVTGIALASVYAPTVTDAWGSVYMIQHEITLGWLVRGLHHFGSSAMIVLCVVHMVQVFFYGAHRSPREANWITGVVMLLLVLGFGLTGYLLPWDQKGYWATQVATSIMGSVPGGEPLQSIAQGGLDYGNLTLTRFYAAHVFVLPISLTLLMISHIALFRRHGVTPSPTRVDEDLNAKTELFWPGQMLRDVVVAGVVLACLVALVLTVGVSLEAPADPGSGYEARPEWYFLFLFQILKLFEGPLVLLGTVVLPGLAVCLLFALPFLEKRSEGPQRPSARTLVPMLVLLGSCAVLTAWALKVDSADEAFQAGRAEADAESALSLEMMKLGGMNADGKIRLHHGLQLFRSKGCETCHRSDPEDVPGPLLGGYGTPAYLTAFMKAPDAKGRFGGTVLEGGMDAFEGSDSELKDVIAWLLSISGRATSDPPLAQELRRGRESFDSHECADCHNPPERNPSEADWEHDATGPDLNGFLSFEWTRRLVLEAGHPVYFGDAIEAEDLDRAMPAYGDDLRPAELDILADWLLAGAPGADSLLGQQP
jgi:ubiquinol-cytochrome c reductase cytochrome b subunit